VSEVSEEEDGRARRRRRRRRRQIQNQKQKPHTSMWGNRKPIGKVGCCESGMAERIH